MSRLPRFGSLDSRILAILIALQLCHTLDFVLMMPLGPTLLRTLQIGPREFGALVSSYTFSAAASGLLLAGFIDRFDRKRALLFLASGFAISTFCCAIAPNYSVLLVARTVAGFFGGVMTALAYTIVGDVIPMERRGSAIGLLSLAFSVTSIVGVPLGLWLSRLTSWQAPFFAIALLSALVIGNAIAVLPPLRSHLDGQAPGQVTNSGLQNLREVLTTPDHWNPFLLMMLLNFAAFSVIPFISASLVANSGMPEQDLQLTYLVGGSATFFTARWMGKLADRYGKLRVFRTMSLLSLLPVLAVTHLPVVPLWISLTCTTVFMICMNGRFVPAVALVTGVPANRLRGGFLAVNSSLQQIAMGLGASISGLILDKGTGGQLQHFNWVGYLSVIATLIAVRSSQGLTRFDRKTSPPILTPEATS